MWPSGKPRQVKGSWQARARGGTGSGWDRGEERDSRPGDWEGLGGAVIGDLLTLRGAG